MLDAEDLLELLEDKLEAEETLEDEELLEDKSDWLERLD